MPGPTSAAAKTDLNTRLPTLSALTPLRLFAALYVVLFHLELQTSLTRFPVAFRFIDSGYTAVTLFFVLSGFVLAYNYPGVPDPRAFWLARFARIYPVYLLALVAVLVHFASDGSLWRRPGFYGDILLSGSLLQAWLPQAATVLNGPSWTLSVEALFYALFPLLIGPARRIRWRAFLLIEAAWLGLAVLPLLLALHPQTTNFAQALAELLESTFPPFRINAFFVGVWLGCVYRRQTGRQQLAASANRSRSWLLLTGVAGSVGLLACAPQTTTRPLRTLLLVCTYGLVVYGLAGSRARWWRWRWLQVGGEISYGVYILQVPVELFIQRLLRPRNLGVIWLDAAQLSALLLTAWFLFRFYETPARRWIRRLPLRPPVAPPLSPYR